MFTVVAYRTPYLEEIVGIWRGCPTQALKKARGHAKFFEHEITEIFVIGTARTQEKAQAVAEAYYRTF